MSAIVLLAIFSHPERLYGTGKLPYLTLKHRKLAVVKKQEYRLRKKVTHLEALIRNLKSNKFLSDDAAGVVSVSN